MSKAREIFEAAVEKFKDDLKAGKNPFEMPMAPINGNTNKPYSGFNRWHLSQTAKEHGYDSCAWLTMKQINALGGKVKRGEKSVPVFMWGFTYVFRGEISTSGHNENEALRKIQKKYPSLTLGDLLRKVPFLKMYLVFELSQTEGVELDLPGRDKTNHDHLIAYAGPEFSKGNFDYYDANADVIFMSELGKGEQHLIYAPMTAWTGHQDRLDRQHELAQERLVQEFGTAFLCEATGEQMGPPNPEYIEQWLEALGKNPYFLWRAAGDAEKAVNYLLENMAAAIAVAA